MIPTTRKAKSKSTAPTAINRLTTLADVARLAGVSCSAAGQVLNGGQGNTRCSEETAKRIRQTPVNSPIIPITPPACSAARGRT